MKAVREPDDAEIPLIEVATAPTKRENSAAEHISDIYFF
jgi:hypothetical protein